MLRVAGPPAGGSDFPFFTQIILPGLLLVGLVLWTFFPAIQNDFVGYDDPDYVTANGRVQQGWNWNNIRWAFQSSEVANWHPLTWLSHLLDCQLYGLQPWGHHLTSVCLHAVNALLAFLVLRHLTGATGRSVAVAALFALHPLRVESVAWIAERKDVLSTLFWLLSLWTYARYAQESRVQSPKSKVREQRAKVGGRTSEAGSQRSEVGAPDSDLRPPASGSYWFSFLFFVLGLMSKPMLVTLPFVLLLLDFWPLNRFQHKSIRRLVAEKIPFFVAALAISLLTVAIQHHAGTVDTNLSWLTRVENVGVSYCRYLAKLFVPIDLAFFYPYPAHWPAGVVLASVLALLSISLPISMARRRRPYLLVGWLWFVGTLVPVIGLIQAGSQSMADRYSYIPSLGIFLMVVWGCYDLTGRWRYRQTLLPVLFVVAALFCIRLTRKQITLWKDSESLFRHALAVTSGNYIAHNNLGTTLQKQGRVDEAIEQFQKALSEKPGDAEVHKNLGLALCEQGRYEEAIRQFKEALTYDPHYAPAQDAWGMALGRQGRLEDAVIHYREAIRLKPDYGDAHYNLGVVLGRSGHLDEAIDEFKKAIKLKPGSLDAYLNLGVTLEKKGQWDEAIRQYREVLGMSPDSAVAHFNLGVALCGKGNLDEGIFEFEQALRLKPDYVEAQKNLDVASSLKKNSAPLKSP